MTVILLRMETMMLMFLSQVLVVRSTSEEARSPECTAPGKGDRFHTNYHERHKKEDKRGKPKFYLFEGSSNENTKVDAIQLEMPAEMRYQGGREVLITIESSHQQPINDMSYQGGREVIHTFHHYNI